MGGSRYKRARSGDAAKSPSKKRRTNARAVTRRAASTFPVEVKYFDTAFSASVASTADWAAANVAMTSVVGGDGALAGYTDCGLIPSAVGTGYGQIIGNKYIARALRVRGELSCTPLNGQTVVVNPPSVRVVLVHDTQPNGAQELGPNVFLDMGTASINNYSFQQMGAGMPGRFKILGTKEYFFRDCSVVNDAAGVSSSITLAKVPFSFVKQWKRGLKTCIKAGGTTPAIAQLIDNNIFLLAHATPGYTVTIQGCGRCYYVD